MAKRLSNGSGRNLFDILDAEKVKTGEAECRHPRVKRTTTVWPGETFERLTMTCEDCGRVRGRYPGE